MLEFYANIKSRTVAQLNWIITGDDKYLSTIQKVNDYFTNLDKPKNLDTDSPDNYIVKTRKQFQQLCITMTINGGLDRPDEMSVFKFLETIQFYETRKTGHGNDRPNSPRRPSIRARTKR